MASHTTSSPIETVQKGVPKSEEFADFNEQEPRVDATIKPAVAPVPRLFINYIPIDKNTEDIHQILKPFGNFVLIQILPNYSPQQPEIKLHQRAWVELPNFTKAESILNKLHGSFPWGKQSGSASGTESETHQHAIFPPPPLEITFANPRLATQYQAAEQAISPKKLFIGGIAPAATENDVRSLLTPFGHIESLILIIRGGGPNRNCAFIQFSTWAACEAAIQALHFKFTMAGTDAPLIVKFAGARRMDPTHKKKMYRNEQSAITPLAAATVYGVYGGGVGGTSSSSSSSYMHHHHQYPAPTPYGMTMMMSPPNNNNTGGGMSGYSISAYNDYHGQQMVMSSAAAYPPSHQGHPHVHLSGDGGGYPTNNGNGGGGGYFSHNNNYYGHQRRGSGGETQYYNSNGFRGRYPRGRPGSNSNHSNNSSRQYNYNPGKGNIGSSSVRSRSSGGGSGSVGSVEAKLTATRLASSENLTTDDVTVLPGETSSKTETASISFSDDKSPKSHGTDAEEVVVYFNGGGGGGGKIDGSDDDKDEGLGHPPLESPRHLAEGNGDDGGREKTDEVGQEGADEEEGEDKEADDVVEEEEGEEEGSEMHEYDDDAGNPSHTTTPTSAAALIAATAKNGNARFSQEHIIINNNSSNQYSNSRGRYCRGRGRKNNIHHHNNNSQYNHHYDHHQQAAAAAAAAYYDSSSYHQHAQYYYAPDVVGEYYQQTSASPPLATYMDGTAEYPITTATAAAAAGYMPPSPLPATMYSGSSNDSNGGITTMPVTDAIAVPNTADVPISTTPMPYSPIHAAVNGGVGLMASPQLLHPLGTSMGHTPAAAARHSQRKGNGKMGKGVKDVALYAHKLFIGQLSFETIEEDLYEWFACFGEILELAVLRSHGKSQGCAFLTYSRKDHALAAKDAMNGKPLGKLRKRIVVKFADVGRAMGGEEGKRGRVMMKNECDDERYEKKK